jgi:hypothetical protein
MAMSYSQDIADELHALKRDAGRLLNSGAEEWRRVSSEKTHTLAADVKTFLTDVRDALALEEAEVERAFAGRAVPALATALAVGIAIGWLLRRKP